jgi:ABC-type transport system involved in cytochrome bd biosynthesis fused ATPase/permease subunit
VDEILSELPLGLDTRIREQGAGLSLGQRQRIALARALLGTPDVLLLDEVDANLDRISRAALERVLAQYPGTILLATHDPELASAADAVWRLEAGRLLEAGDPALTR